MKPAIKKRWVAALRSGKFKKTKGALHTSEGYCCLGVLSELYSKSAEGKRRKAKWSPGGKTKSGGIVYRMLGASGVLPIEVTRWAGLSDANPYIRHRRYSELAEINDESNTTFKGIATLIEKQF